MSDKLELLKERLGEVEDIGRAASVLGWDQQVNMPPGGHEARGRQLATLSKIAQEKFITDEVGRLIDDLKQTPIEILFRHVPLLDATSLETMCSRI